MAYTRIERSSYHVQYSELAPIYIHYGKNVDTLLSPVSCQIVIQTQSYIDTTTKVDYESSLLVFFSNPNQRVEELPFPLISNRI